MSAWPFFVDVVGIVVTILDLRWKVSQSIDRCMAMAAAAGCA
jgi:hypothetical protein